MKNWELTRRRLSAIAAACLLSVALPAVPAMAKEKHKTPDTVAPATTDDTAAPADDTAAPADDATTDDTTTDDTAAAPEAPAAPVEFKLDIPTINADGSNLDDATLRDIIAGHIADHAAELAKLDAKSIVVPTVTFSFSAPNAAGKPVDGTIVYKDFTLTDIKAGSAASSSISGVDIDSSDGFKMTIGKISTGTLDIGGMLAVYGLVPAAPDAGFKTIYADLNAEGGKLTAPEANCTVGPMEIASFEARPLKTPFIEMMNIAKDIEADGETPTPKHLGQILHMYADVLSAFKSSPVTFGGIDCSGNDDGQPVKFAIGGMSIGGFDPGFYPEVQLNGLTADVSENGSFSLDNFTSKKFDLSGPIAAINAAPEEIDEAWITANVRKLIPAYAGFSISGVAVDAPNPESPGEHIKGSLANFDLSLASYFNGIPTAVKTSAQNIVIDLPKDTTDEQMKQLIDLGLTKLDFGFGLDAAWSEASQSIAVNDLSVTGADLATVRFAGNLGNVATALYSDNVDEAMAAAMGIVVKSLDLDVLDAGLSDLVLKKVSAEQGGDAASMRGVYGSLAQGTIISFLAGQAEANNVGKAVSDFIAGTAKKLHIGLTAKSDTGITLTDFIAAEEDPTQLIGKVNVTANAK